MKEAELQGLSKPSGSGTNTQMEGVIVKKGKAGQPDKIVERFKLHPSKKGEKSKKEIITEDRLWKNLKKRKNL